MSKLLQRATRKACWAWARLQENEREREGGQKERRVVHREELNVLFGQELLLLVVVMLSIEVLGLGLGLEKSSLDVGEEVLRESNEEEARSGRVLCQLKETRTHVETSFQTLSLLHS